MQKIHSQSNPNRNSIVLKRFNFALFDYSPIDGLITKGDVSFEVPRNFKGAVVEYLSYTAEFEGNEYLVTESTVNLHGFDDDFLKTKLVNSCLVKSDKQSHVRYAHCKTQMDFVLAKASRSNTLIYASALRPGINELPTYSIGEPLRCAALVRCGVIIDFKTITGNDIPMLFGVSRSGKSIVLKKSNVDELVVPNSVEQVTLLSDVSVDDNPVPSLNNNTVREQVEA